jgi:regulator of sigma E protease
VSSILAAIIAFGAMIFFHELGHFLMAKRAGVLIHAFAIGFGPSVVSWRRGPTTYSVNLLPFGGYVRMEGEDTDGGAAAGTFRSKSVGWRIAIIAAGPIMNLALAVAILTLMAATGGVPTGASNRVGTLEPGWPAVEAGIRPGDAIVAIDDVPTATGEQVIQIIHRSAGKPLRLRLSRGNEELTVTVTPRLDPQRNVGRIGFQPEPVWRRLGLPQALAWGARESAEYVAFLVSAIGMLIREGELFRNLGGPLAAGQILAQAAASGVQLFLSTAASLSIIIGVFNLLPIPALDGGRLVFLLMEAVRRRPVDPRREGFIHMVGFALLLLLLLVLTIKDARSLLLRLFS